ncbi:MAG: PepSY domain-containing protein [Lachnospiraceae bacterium]|nr:PepSY domain-containing protein [Lachnospiraceae bacterium]
MNKDKLREALIISIEQDAAAFSSSEESSHRFSPRFEARMDRMIKKQKKGNVKTSLSSKRTFKLMHTINRTKSERKAEMKKKILLIGMTAFATVLIIGIVAMKSDPMKKVIKEAELQIEEVTKAIGLENAIITYKGVVDDHSFNQGRAEFISGEYHFYYDLGRKELAYIYNSSPHEAETNLISKEDIQKKSDAILVAVKGERILQMCREREKEEPKTNSEYKCFIDGNSVSVADIEIDDYGVLICAAFQKTQVPRLEEDIITPEKALEAARKSAEDFLKTKKREDMKLEEDSVSVTKSLISGKSVYLCEMTYSSEINDIPCYFNIIVDAATGKVLENANSFT